MYKYLLQQHVFVMYIISSSTSSTCGAYYYLYAKYGLRVGTGLRLSKHTVSMEKNGEIKWVRDDGVSNEEAAIIEKEIEDIKYSPTRESELDKTRYGKKNAINDCS